MLKLIKQETHKIGYQTKSSPSMRTVIVHRHILRLDSMAYTASAQDILTNICYGYNLFF